MEVFLGKVYCGLKPVSSIQEILGEGVQAEQRLQDGIHVASVPKVGKPERPSYMLCCVCKNVCLGNVTVCSFSCFLQP